MCSQASQDRLQQQLSHAKAACKASDCRQADLLAQHEAQAVDFKTQVEAAQQQIAELEAAHQQAISDHIVTAKTLEQQEQDSKQQQTRYAACVSEQLAAMENLQREVATAAEEAERHMTSVAADTVALQQAYGKSQVEAQQELQQLRAEVADWQLAHTSTGEQPQSQVNVAAVLARLVDMQHQLVDEGRPGLSRLMDEHEQVKAQVSSISLCNLHLLIGARTAVALCHEVMCLPSSTAFIVRPESRHAL